MKSLIVILSFLFTNFFIISSNNKPEGLSTSPGALEKNLATLMIARALTL